MPAAGEDSLDRLRGYAFAVAYRMLGSVADAEDVVQEGLLRMHQAEEAGERIESRRAYLSTVVTRLSIDELRSARARREEYFGEWLPEPVVETAAEPGPAEHAELADTLSMSFMVLLESLSPEQRAAFLLHDVFDFPYEQIADVVGKNEPATRQLVSRARKAVSARRPRFEASPEKREELADRFFAAVFEGEVEDLKEMLAEDVEMTGDGGGKVPALGRIMQGAAQIASAIGKWGIIGRRSGSSFHRVEINGQPGALIVDAEGNPYSAIDLDIRDGKVHAIHAVVNPDKLAHLGRVGDMRRVIREGVRK